jgi:hypothetical protein
MELIFVTLSSTALVALYYSVDEIRNGIRTVCIRGRGVLK